MAGNGLLQAARHAAGMVFAVLTGLACWAVIRLVPELLAGTPVADLWALSQLVAVVAVLSLAERVWARIASWLGSSEAGTPDH